VKSMPERIADSLSVSERLLLFCVATDSDWAGAGITNATLRFLEVIKLIEPKSAAKGFILTERGQAVLAALGGPLSSPAPDA
jgi:hypothetical protein